MAYDKTTWTTGDIITAEKLNNIETGIESGGNIMLVTTIYDNETAFTTLTKTWQEIYDAVESGVIVLIMRSFSYAEDDEIAVSQKIYMVNDVGTDHTSAPDYPYYVGVYELPSDGTASDYFKSANSNDYPSCIFS